MVVIVSTWEDEVNICYEYPNGLEAEDAFDHPIITGPPFSQAVICPSLGYADPAAGSGSQQYVKMGAMSLPHSYKDHLLCTAGDPGHCTTRGHPGPPLWATQHLLFSLGT